MFAALVTLEEPVVSVMSTTSETPVISAMFRVSETPEEQLDYVILEI